MIKLSRLTDYAFIILTRFVTSDDTMMSSAQIAGETRLSEATVSKVLKKLSRGKILSATRGAHGGYRLSGNPADISLADVITVMEGPIALTACVEGSTDQCDIEQTCPLKGHWTPVNIILKAALDGVTLEDITKFNAQRLRDKAHTLSVAALEHQGADKTKEAYG